MIYTRSHISNKKCSKLTTYSSELNSNYNIVKSLEFNNFNDSSLLDISNIDENNKNLNHVSTLSWLDHDLKYTSYDGEEIEQ